MYGSPCDARETADNRDAGLRVQGLGIQGLGFEVQALVGFKI